MNPERSPPPPPPISAPTARRALRVLGVESSCDETGLAVYDTGLGLLAERLHSQVELHATYGGVVPELASREHVNRLAPLTREALAEASERAPRGTQARPVDAVSYTRGPGLAGALLAGASFARGLAHAWGVPAIGVHHLEGHLLAPMLEDEQPSFPFVALLVSGGHSQLVRVAALGSYQLLGDTLDDAAGEAFDKTASLLGLGYPGGPALARCAEGGDPAAFRLPRPMLDRPGLDLSFSGLKTSVRRTLELAEATLPKGDVAARDTLRANIARGFEDAVVETLVEKCRRALDATGLDALVVAGGVGANRRLRAALQAMTAGLGGRTFYPRPQLCTDNGAMIALAGALRFEAGQRDVGALPVRPRWPLAELSAPGC